MLIRAVVTAIFIYSICGCVAATQEREELNVISGTMMRQDSKDCTFLGDSQAISEAYFKFATEVGSEAWGAGDFYLCSIMGQVSYRGSIWSFNIDLSGNGVVFRRNNDGKTEQVRFQCESACKRRAGWDESQIFADGPVLE